MAANVKGRRDCNTPVHNLKCSSTGAAQNIRSAHTEKALMETKLFECVQVWYTDGQFSVYGLTHAPSFVLSLTMLRSNSIPWCSFFCSTIILLRSSSCRTSARFRSTKLESHEHGATEGHGKVGGGKEWPSSGRAAGAFGSRDPENGEGAPSMQFGHLGRGLLR